MTEISYLGLHRYDEVVDHLRVTKRHAATRKGSDKADDKDNNCRKISHINFVYLIKTLTFFVETDCLYFCLLILLLHYHFV